MYPKYNIKRIRNSLNDAAGYSGERIHYFDVIDSTNAWLARQKIVDGQICIAEEQPFGKGRQGKSWVSCKGGSVIMSLGRKLPESNFSAISLVSGLAVMGGLAELGVTGIELKWPNDVKIHGKKLGGILVEISAASAVIGVGLNLDVGQNISAEVDQPWTDLTANGFNVDRDQLVVEIIKAHDRMLEIHSEKGFSEFAPKWNSVNEHKDREVKLRCNKHLIQGINRGVDETGALLIETGKHVHRIISGEYSLVNGY